MSMQTHDCDSTHTKKKHFIIAEGQNHYHCTASETNRAEGGNYPVLFSQLSGNVNPTAKEEGEEEEEEKEEEVKQE